MLKIGLDKLDYFSLIYINTPPFNLMRYDFTNKKWVWCGREAFVKILQNKD